MIKLYETDRLIVRPFTKEDIQGNYQNWWTDTEVTKYNSHGLFPYTKNQMLSFLERLESSSDIVWAVIVKERGKDLNHPENTIYNADENLYYFHIGNISLQNINWIYRSAEFACIFGEKEYWGKGYCTEAAKLLFEHGFKKLGLHRIWTGTAETNIGMRSVAVKLKMASEGVFLDGMFLDGQFVNVHTYGVLDKEWFKNDLNEGAE